MGILEDVAMQQFQLLRRTELGHDISKKLITFLKSRHCTLGDVE